MSKRIVPYLIGIAFISSIAAGESRGQCACHPGQPTAKSEFAKSDVAFVAKVIEVKRAVRLDQSYFEAEVRFEVRRVWKSDLKNKVIVVVTSEGEDTFEKHAEWLIYAKSGNDGELTAFVSCCTRTRPLSVVKEDLIWLEKMGDKPKKILNKQ